MEYEAILEVLGFANGNEQQVKLVLLDGTEIYGLPSSVDLHPTAHEVFIRPAGDDATEIALSLGAITSAELI